MQCDINSSLIKYFLDRHRNVVYTNIHTASVIEKVDHIAHVSHQSGANEVTAQDRENIIQIYSIKGLDSCPVTQISNHEEDGWQPFGSHASGY